MKDSENSMEVQYSNKDNILQTILDKSRDYNLLDNCSLKDYTNLQIETGVLGLELINSNIKDETNNTLKINTNSNFKYKGIDIKITHAEKLDSTLIYGTVDNTFFTPVSATYYVYTDNNHILTLIPETDGK